MKVEFRDSEVYGPNLYVEGKEFLKASKSRSEFESLKNAVFAFYNGFGLYLKLSIKEYNAIAEKTNLHSAVAFVIQSDERQNHIWYEVWVLQDNNINKVIV